MLVRRRCHWGLRRNTLRSCRGVGILILVGVLGFFLVLLFLRMPCWEVYMFAGSSLTYELRDRIMSAILTADKALARNG